MHFAELTRELAYAMPLPAAAATTINASLPICRRLFSSSMPAVARKMPGASYAAYHQLVDIATRHRQRFRATCTSLFIEPTVQAFDTNLLTVRRRDGMNAADKAFRRPIIHYCHETSLLSARAAALIVA